VLTLGLGLLPRSNKEKKGKKGRKMGGREDSTSAAGLGTEASVFRAKDLGDGKSGVRG
jgi:hypothetical protein